MKQAAMTAQEPTALSPSEPPAGQLRCSQRLRALPEVASSATVVEPGAASSQTRAEDLWNGHGQRLYSLAYALIGDETAAMQAVALGMVDLVRSDRAMSANDTGCALARHVYVRSVALSDEASPRTVLPPAMEWLAQLADLQRASIALCAFGGHTCGCAAEVLGIAVPVVAQLLTSGLAEIGRMITTSATDAAGVALPAVLVR
jgi:DNA-directed RNA polymerase specialized sigma24 family protein